MKHVQLFQIIKNCTKKYSVKVTCSNKVSHKSELSTVITLKMRMIIYTDSRSDYRHVQYHKGLYASLFTLIRIYDFSTIGINELSSEMRIIQEKKDIVFVPIINPDDVSFFLTKNTNQIFHEIKTCNKPNQTSSTAFVKEIFYLF